MARGHVPGPQSDAWEKAREAIAGPWPEALVEMDLAYWSDPISCERKSRPGVRTLAETWGWGKTKASDFIRAWDTRQSADTSRTVGGQAADTRPTANASNPATSGQSADTSRTVGGQPLVDTRARSSLVSRLSEEQQAPKAARTPPGWEEAVEVYQTVYRPAIGKRVHPPLQPDRGNGRHLATLLKRHGVDETVRLLRHCATSPKRSYLREQGYDLQTVVRHSADYLDDAINEAPRPRPAPDVVVYAPPPPELDSTPESRAALRAIIGGRRAS